MKSFRELIRETLQNLNEGNAFDMLNFDEDGNITKGSKKPRASAPRLKKEKAKTPTTTDIREILGQMSDRSRAHLLGSCFKHFKFFSNDNKIYITIYNDDNFKITNLSERVGGGKEIIITRGDINSIFQEVSKNDISGIINKIRDAKLSDDDLGKSSYYFKTTETENERPITRDDVSTTGEFETTVSRNRNNIKSGSKNRVGKKEINQLVLKVTRGSSGYKRADNLRLYTKPVTNKYVINSSAINCLKIKDHEIYIFIIPGSNGNVGVCILENSERKGIDIFNSPAFLTMLISSLAAPKLSD